MKIVARAKKSRYTVTDSYDFAMGCGGGDSSMFDVRWLFLDYVVSMTFLSLCRGDFDYCFYYPEGCHEASNLRELVAA